MTKEADQARARRHLSHARESGVRALRALVRPKREPVASAREKRCQTPGGMARGP